MSAPRWGANLPGTRVVGQDAGIDPYTMVFVPLAVWSDGAPDAAAPPKPSM